MKIDLAVIEDGEFMVAQVEARSERGTDFLDAYCPDHEYTVVDSGRVIVPQDRLSALLAVAAAQGLVAA